MNQLYEILGIPFGFILTLVYNVVHNYGLALIIFTFISRLLMLPSSITQQKSQAKTQRLQPKIRKIQAKYAGNQQKIQEETQALYQREGQNPMNMGCSSMALQFPIMFGLIGAIYNPLRYPLGLSKEAVETLKEGAAAVFPDLFKNDMRSSHSFIIEHIAGLKDYVAAADFTKISEFNFKFLGMELGATPMTGDPKWLYWLVPISSFLATMASSLYTYFRQRQTNPETAKNPMTGCMTFGMPLFSLFIAFQFPVGIGIYWTAGSVFSFIQTIILSKTHSPQKMQAKLMIEDAIQRRSREENLKKVAQMRSDAS